MCIFKIYILIAQIRNVEVDKCLDAMASAKKLEMYPCHHLGSNQAWVMTAKGEIRNDNMCIDAPIESGQVLIYNCHGDGGNQKWEYNEKVSEL